MMAAVQQQLAPVVVAVPVVVVFPGTDQQPNQSVFCSIILHLQV